MNDWTKGEQTRVLVNPDYVPAPQMRWEEI